MARVFNGSSQYASNTSFASGAFPITISTWFQTTTTSGFQRVASWMNSGSDVLASILLNYPSAGSIANQTYLSGVNSLPSISGMSANTWHHAAVVSTNTGNTVYLDGVQGSSLSYTPPSISGFTFFHLGYIPSTQYLNGRAAYVAVYNAALTADEIADLGRKLNGAPCGVHPIRIRPESLVACWPLGGFHGEHDGDIWKDSYNLTAYGSPTWDESPAVIYPSRKKIIFPVSSAAPPSSTKYSWWAWNTFGTPLDHDARS